MELNVDIFEHYGFDNQNANRLKEIAPIMESYKDQLADEFCQNLLRFKNISSFLSKQAALNSQKKNTKAWFMKLFDGEYDLNYLKDLQGNGISNKKIGLDGHYVNVAINFVRRFSLEILEKEIENPTQRKEAEDSLQKILDINLDIMTGYSNKAEPNKVFLSKKIDSLLVNFCARYTVGLNLIVLVGLIILSMAVVGMFFVDISHIFAGNVAHGVISSLGTMLIMWVMIELMSMEIHHLQGGDTFSLKIFAEVGLAAFIRDTLVASLHHEDVNKLIILAGIVLILAVVYWIIARTEIEEKRSRR